ncbi:ROK family protein [Oceaniglobus ichthyenteri]|uniref:ROK family protein n=1 Tax=Oceaniglobus ichthyenteri TaxID=2136177 RepID=UPI0013DDB192|nr:ROK family protein [Oceaniglobus ichthyenteri]
MSSILSAPFTIAARQTSAPLPRCRFLSTVAVLLQIARIIMAHASPPHRPVAAGIDLGGTKIEATLFGADLLAITARRTPTPNASYGALLAALEHEVQWLRRQAGCEDLPVGIGMPGLVDAQTGVTFAANLSANGQRLSPDLRDRVGGTVVAANDSQCFTLSESCGGAARNHRRVFGLALGTGVGGGLCQDGRLVPGLNGMAGEIGHYGISALLARTHDLPLLTCGCGRVGCYETLISGTGMANLATALIGAPRTARSIGAHLDDPGNQRVMAVWADLAGELLHTIMLHVDPDCIVLGGGLSNIPDLDTYLAAAVDRAALPRARRPEILKPAFGDSSGCRGAALLARDLHNRM